MFDVKPVVGNRATDCGAVSLKMLLGYYGIDVELDQLKEELNIRLIGCTGADIMRVSRLPGLEPTAWKMAAEELAIQDRPAIIHWQQDHWVVFCGVTERGQIVIANPTRGRFGVDFGTFKARYSGTVIANGTPVALQAVAADNYAMGQIFEQDGVIWRALKAIARGEALSDAVERVSVADTLNEIVKEQEA